MKTSRTLTHVGLFLLLGGMALGYFYLYSADEPEESARPVVPIEQVVALFNEGQHEALLQALDGIPLETFDDWRYPYYLGSAQIMLRDYQEAVASLEQALALNERGTSIHYALGVAYYKQGNLKLAKAYFAAALEIDPADENARGMMDIMTRLERRMESAPASVPDQQADDP